MDGLTVEQLETKYPRWSSDVIEWILAAGPKCSPFSEAGGFLGQDYRVILAQTPCQKCRLPMGEHRFNDEGLPTCP